MFSSVGSPWRGEHQLNVVQKNVHKVDLKLWDSVHSQRLQPTPNEITFLLATECIVVTDIFLTIEEAAELLRISPRSAYTLAREGRLAGAVKVGINGV